MTSYGLTANGFVKKTASDLLTEIRSDYEAQFGSIDWEHDKVFRDITAIESDRLAELWDLAEAVYYSNFRDTALGQSLQYVGARVGVGKYEAVKSTATVTLGTTGASDIVIPAGTILRQSESGRQWVTLLEVTIPAGSTVNVSVQCSEYGPFLSTSINEAVTVISGLDSVATYSAGTTGRYEESNSGYRIRIATDPYISRGGVPEAIKSILKQVDGVSFVSYKENDTDTVNGDGLPAHSISYTIVGGTDADIAETMFYSYPAGIASYGSESDSFTDGYGVDHTFYWNRTTEIPIYFIVNITSNSNWDVTNGPTNVKSVIETFINDLEVSENVNNWQVIASLALIDGIDSVTILQGTSSPPTVSTNISISSTEKAVTDTANITVNVS